MAPPLEIPIPEPDIEVRLATKLMARGSDLERRILFELLGRSKRYSELRPLLRGKADNNLTVALAHLDEDGLIAQRYLLRDDPPTFAHELTQLGILVALMIHSIGLLGRQAVLERVGITEAPTVAGRPHARGLHAPAPRSRRPKPTRRPGKPRKAPRANSRSEKRAR